MGLTFFVLLVVLGVCVYDYFETRDSQLTSGEHNDAVFNSRNKKYGAYAMRRTYNRVMIIIVGCLIGLLASALFVQKTFGAFSATETEVPPPVDTVLLSLNAPPIEQIETLPEKVEIEGKEEGSEEPVEDVRDEPIKQNNTPENSQPESINNTDKPENTVKGGAAVPIPPKKKGRSTPEQEIIDFERNLHESSPEKQKQEEIRRKMEERKRQRAQQATQASNAASSKPVKVGSGTNNSENGPMVKWVLKDRTPYNNDEWQVRNPGYTCGKGLTGTVKIKIRVSSSGTVETATPMNDVSNINECLVNQAIKYAKMSRFNSSNTPLQEGTIEYQFVSQ